MKETFYYDDLNRLDRSTLEMAGIVAPFTNLDLAYDEAGNIKWKSGVGDYCYDSSRPHALTSINESCGGIDTFTYDPNGNLLSDGDRTVTWSSYNYPLSVTRGSLSSHFEYGPDRQRYREEQRDGGELVRRTTVVGSHFETVEEDGIVTYKHYIRAGTKVVAIHDRKSTGEISTHYLLRDHLGSVSAIADETGEVVRMSFDAFGQRRGSADSETPWQGEIDPTALAGIRDITTRGYTGHQMVDNVGLIHMGGRIYDPELGRFLSPDPNIPDPGNTQAYNRYAYVYNNPLSFTDPSGFVPHAPWLNLSNGADDGTNDDTADDCETPWDCLTEEEKQRIKEENDRGRTATIIVTYADGTTEPIIIVPSDASSAANNGSNSTNYQGIGITEEQRQLAADGKVREFWESRKAMGDPVADIALASLDPQGTVGDYLFGGESVNNRLQAFARVYTGNGLNLDEVRTQLMNAHIRAVDSDKTGVLGLLNPEQIARYHHTVFERLGLPTTAFGGTPFTGAVGEANWTRTFWCRGCDWE